MYWLFFYVQHSILYPILCALTTVFVHILYFSAVSPFKVFPTACSSQYCSRQFLPITMNFLSLFHSIVGFFFTSLRSSLLPFLCSLSFSFHSWNRAGICFFVGLISIPQQVFSLSFTLFFHLLSICLFLILHQPNMVGQATPLDETQENMSPAINAKYSNDRRHLGPVTQIKFLKKV